MRRPEELKNVVVQSLFRFVLKTGIKAQIWVKTDRRVKQNK